MNPWRRIVIVLSDVSIVITSFDTFGLLPLPLPVTLAGPFLSALVVQMLQQSIANVTASVSRIIEIWRGRHL